jgi:pimeloyl-ACP methyl ester carboxylesterase
MVALAAKTAPILPTRWLVLDRYDTLAKAPRIHQPTLVIHGASDPVVPCYMGQMIAARVGNAMMRLVSNADHNDVLAVGGAELWGNILAFAKAAPP